jgi:hypothetical protein
MKPLSPLDSEFFEDEGGSCYIVPLFKRGCHTFLSLTSACFINTPFLLLTNSPVTKQVRPESKTIHRMATPTPPQSLKDSVENSKAEYVQLGKSGLRVSVPILGAMSIGHPGWAPWVIDEEKVFLLPFSIALLSLLFSRVCSDH